MHRRRSMPCAWPSRRTQRQRRPGLYSRCISPSLHRTQTPAWPGASFLVREGSLSDSDSVKPVTPAVSGPDNHFYLSWGQSCRRGKDWWCCERPLAFAGCWHLVAEVSLCPFEPPLTARNLKRARAHALEIRCKIHDASEKSLGA